MTSKNKKRLQYQLKELPKRFYGNRYDEEFCPWYQKKLNYIYWLLKWAWVWPEMPMKSIWLLCLRTALKQLTMHGNGVIKAFIGQICFKQCLVIIYNWLLYRIARVKVWFSVASLTLWGEYCVYDDFWSETQCWKFCHFKVLH